MREVKGSDLDVMLAIRPLNSNFNLGLLNVQLSPKLCPNYCWGKVTENTRIENVGCFRINQQHYLSLAGESIENNLQFKVCQFLLTAILYLLN